MRVRLPMHLTVLRSAESAPSYSAEPLDEQEIPLSHTPGPVPTCRTRLQLQFASRTDEQIAEADDAAAINISRTRRGRGRTGTPACQKDQQVVESDGAVAVDVPRDQRSASPAAAAAVGNAAATMSTKLVVAERI